MSESLPIRIDGIRKCYGAYVALDSVSLDIHPGEFLTLLGPSGSGKTTLLMAIGGFARPEEGQIFIGDRDVVRLPPNKRDIGIVFQNYALFPHMSVVENVIYPLKIRSVPREEARARALEALALVKLDTFADRAITALSGGQRQRIALARAIVYRPAVMLMDEPLSALDKNLREQMQFEIRRLHETLGITTIYVTHDQREALTMSDRIAVMNRGRIEQVDTPQSIYLAPRTPFVADFMGEANILPASAARFAKDAPPPASQFMVRAEHLRLVGPEADGGPWGVRVQGRLAAKVFRGENWLARLDVGGDRALMLNIPALDGGQVSRLEIGDACAAVAPAGYVHVFCESVMP